MTLTIERVETIKSLSYRIKRNCDELNNNQIKFSKEMKKNMESFFDETAVGKFMIDQFQKIDVEIKDLIEQTESCCKKVNIFADNEKETILSHKNNNIV